MHEELTQVERYCPQCKCLRAAIAVEKRWRCTVCLARDAQPSGYRRERGTAEVPYTRHTASEALSEVEREQAERLRLLESGVNPHAPPEKTIEELLAEGEQ